MIGPVLRAPMIAASLAAVFLSSGCMRGLAEAPIAGVELYESCSTCHGSSGEGNAAIGAPTIAGLPEWYVTAQLERFQTGLRGKHPDDAEGLRMRAMSRQMLSPAEVTAVAAHVSSLVPVTSAPSISGADAAAGQEAYTLCLPCHGAKGEGNPAVKAPPLAGLDDWYVAAQLRKFRAGIRGTAPGDPVGPVMQAMSMAVPPESVNHLAAYVHTLSK